MDRRTKPTAAPIPRGGDPLAEDHATEALLDELFGDPDDGIASGEAVQTTSGGDAKEEVRLALDPHILDAFRASGSDWPVLINEALANWLVDNEPGQVRSA